MIQNIFGLIANYHKMLTKPNYLHSNLVTHTHTHTHKYIISGLIKPLGSWYRYVRILQSVQITCY
jgi:hypothetical protein